VSRPIVDAREPAHVRAAVREVLAAAWVGALTSDHATLRPGFLTACRLYAAANRHPYATAALRQSLFQIAVARVVIARRREAATA